MIDRDNAFRFRAAPTLLGEFHSTGCSRNNRRSISAYPTFVSLTRRFRKRNAPSFEYYWSTMRKRKVSYWNRKESHVSRFSGEMCNWRVDFGLAVSFFIIDICYCFSALVRIMITCFKINLIRVLFISKYTCIIESEIGY